MSEDDARLKSAALGCGACLGGRAMMVQAAITDAAREDPRWQLRD
jgi:hypothetical protein